MLYSKRNLEVREMRKQGMKLREIGEKTGLTTDRVRQICVALDLREQRTGDPLYDALNEAAIKMDTSPARAYNCLRKAGIYTLEEAAKYTDEQLMRIRNVGSKTLCIIREAQVKQGFKTMPDVERSYGLISKMIDDLEDIADLLQANRVNVKRRDGVWLNSAMGIHSRAKVIHDEVLSLMKMVKEAVNE